VSKETIRFLVDVDKSPQVAIEHEFCLDLRVDGWGLPPAKVE
jgi:hypothetical protein